MSNSAIPQTRVLTLSACHNRRALTVAALADLHAQILPASVTLSHALVDDGSTDGTAAAVRAEFPKTEIIIGDGTLFWAGGMRYGWERYVRRQRFDYLFVYNDDARFEPTALAGLLAAAVGPDAPHVVVGSFLNAEGNRATYGGRRRSSRWHPLKFGRIVEPDGSVQEADTLNMNGALISRGALDRVGFLSDFFLHSCADLEFGLKLRKSGGRVLVAPGHIGRCAMNPASEILPQDAPTLSAAVAMLFDPKREPFGQRLSYYRRHGGWLWPFFWITPYLTIWFHEIRRRSSGTRDG